MWLRRRGFAVVAVVVLVCEGVENVRRFHGKVVGPTRGDLPLKRREIGLEIINLA